MPLRSHPSGPPAGEVRPSSGGIGRSTSNSAEAVSDALRRHDSAHLRSRRRGALLQMISAASLGVVALYQFGIIRKVPEPSLPGLDADVVDASGEAYAVGRTPDASLGIASAGISLVLAGMGAESRTSDKPLVPLALFAKTLLDAVSGAYLTAEQVTKHKKICSYCTASAIALIATPFVAWPEARDALKARPHRSPLHPSL